MEITIATVTPEGLLIAPADVPEGTTLGEAVRLLKLAPLQEQSISLWGRRARDEDVLAAGDRIDVCPALLCDPKKVRRERAEKQGDVRTVTCGRHGSRRTKKEQ